MMCQRIGLPPISIIGFGLRCDSSEIRVPRPPASMTAFIIVLTMTRRTRDANDQRKTGPSARALRRSHREDGTAIRVRTETRDLPGEFRADNARPLVGIVAAGPARLFNLEMHRVVFKKERLDPWAVTSNRDYVHTF